MNMEQSIVIRELTRRINEDLRRRNVKKRPKRLNATNIENDFVHDPGPVSADLRRDVELIAMGASGWRNDVQNQVREDISGVWRAAFDSLDRCLSTGDLLYDRLARAIFGNGSNVLLGKDPRHNPENVTGAFVKCLLLLSLYGKSCSVASEIFTMVRNGFPDGALARLRTLHEHLVVSIVLSHDHSYEVSERYHDRAVFESLQQMQIEKRAYADPVFVYPDGFLADLESQISEAERYARMAKARWGAAIEEQYGWARPLLPRAKKNKPRIYFTDLEQIAGMDFLRGDYLRGNDRIHAGPFAAINHLNLDSVFTPPTHPCREDAVIFMVGIRTAFLLGGAGRIAGKQISWETEEYDEFLYVCEMQRAADAAMDTFKMIEAGLPDSSKGVEVEDSA